MLSVRRIITVHMQSETFSFYFYLYNNHNNNTTNNLLKIYL